MGQFSEGKEKGNSESELINELHFVPKLIKKYEKKKKNKGSTLRRQENHVQRCGRENRCKVDIDSSAHS